MSSSQTTHIFTSFPDSAQDSDDNRDNLNHGSYDAQNPLLADDDDTSNNTNYSFWQVEYYQKFFNVDTTDVIARIVGSMTPTFSSNFLLNKIRPNPDLYGPFWISITLISTIAITSNIVSYFEHFEDAKVTSAQIDFTKVTTSAAAILSYWWLVPMALYTTMKWRQITSDFTFIEMLCIYGYSLSIYIPVSILWLIHIKFLQWTLVLVALLLSGSVLVLTFWPVFGQDTSKQMSFIVMASIFLLHGILAIGFMLFFFKFDTNNPNNPLSPTRFLQENALKTNSSANNTF